MQRRRIAIAVCSILALPLNVGAQSAQTRGRLRESVLVYMPLDGSLDVQLGPSGLAWQAEFARDSIAYDSRWRRIEHGQPRFEPSPFGKGLLIEHGSGGFSDFRRSTRNNLRPEQASPAKSLAGFEPVRQGQLDFVARAPLVGDGCIRVQAPAAGIGARTQPIPLHHVMRYIASLYLRGAAGGESVELHVEDAAVGVRTEPTRIKLTQHWQRAFNILPIDERKGTLGKRKIDALSGVSIVLTSCDKRPVAFDVDALMLEQSGIFYDNASTPSSWVPGGVSRDADRLWLPVNELTWNPGAGAVAFWLKPMPTKGNRTYFSLGTSHSFPWNIDETCRGLGFSARGNTRYLGRGKRLAPAGRWSHCALTWDEQQAKLFVNGKVVGQMPLTKPFDAAALREREHTMAWGGAHHPGWSPHTFADAVFAECIVFRRALSEREVQWLAERRQPLGATAPITLQPLRPTRAFGREEQVTIPFEIRNRSARELTDVRVRFIVRGFDAGKAQIAAIPARGRTRVQAAFAASMLKPGRYDLAAQISAQGIDATVRYPIDIGPYRHAGLDVLVWRWGGAPALDATLRGLGVTIAYSHSAFNTDANTLAGLHSCFWLRYTGETRPGHDEDRQVDITGKLTTRPRIHNAFNLERARRVGLRWGRRLAGHSSVRHAVINTEHPNRFDFSEPSRREAMERCGLDLRLWMQAVAKGRNIGLTYLPMGKLSPEVLCPTPKGQPVDAATDPLYRFVRWWHKNRGIARFNELLADGLRQRAPQVQPIFEPILRAPPVVRYAGHHTDFAQEWVYYADPKNMVFVQEGLNTLARLSGMKPTGMPQFLFKPGMAAPFGATPPPHLLREAVWLCCAQPIRMMSFWNLQAAVNQGKQWTIERVEKEFAGLEWAQARAKLKGMKQRPHLWHPGTSGEFGNLSRTLWRPFGPLIARWRNRPRRVAVVWSLAASIYSARRYYTALDYWRGPLFKAVKRSGAPYDVLYDESFERDPARLARYDIIVAPRAYALTKPAAAALNKCTASGALVLVDDACPLDLPGAMKLTPTDDDEGFARWQQLWRGRFATATQRQPDAYAESDDVVWNVLEYRGSNFLVAVNDRRNAGRYFGQWGKVREDGVAQDATFRVARSLGAVAYDLTRSRRVELSEAEGAWMRLKVGLPPAGGRIVAFYAEPVRGLNVAAPTRVRRGATAQVEVRLASPSKGATPAHVAVQSPDGSSDLSGYTLIEDGKLTVRLPIAVNDPAGAWQIRVRELASGQEAAGEFAVE